MSSSRPPSVDSSSASATIATIDADGLGRAARVQSVLALHQLTHFRTICWADEKDDLAARIADHRRLSAHWDTLKAAPTLRGGEAVAKGDRQSRHGVPGLPCVHEVRYESLIDHFEPEARRLITACGLEWEPACRRFHETSRPVRTASVTQVRRPLYRQSVGRWKNYEPYLANLFDRLPHG